MAAVERQASVLPDKAPSRVVDVAGILDAAREQSLDARLAEFERESSTQIVVVTIPSLGGEEISDFANRLFERWGLGQKGQNNGVLLLVATGDRKARIEVGYGLEDRLTDALSRRILEERLFPAFRQGRYADGIDAASDGIVEASKGAYVGRPRKKVHKGVPLAALVFVVFVVVMILIALQRGSSIGPRGRRRYYRSGPIIWGGGGGWGAGGGGWSSGGGGWGGGGGGGFSGGGGLSGGGGASGSW